MLQRSYLTACLNAVAPWVTTLKSLVFRSALSFYTQLRSFGHTQKHTYYLYEPQLLSLGSTGFVYQLSDAIVVKNSRPGRSEYITHEQDIFAMLERQPLSP